MMIIRTARNAMAELRRQPLVASVMIIGTAFAVFLIMVVMMMQQITTVNITPETHRERLMIGKNFHTMEIGQEAQGSSAGLSYPMARRLYSGLEGVDTVTFVSRYSEHVGPQLAEAANRNVMMASLATVDAAFWSVFDFRFIEGRPFDEGEVESGVPMLVLSRKAAETLFGSPADAIGRDVTVADHKGRVIGVVENVSELAFNAYADIYGTLNPWEKDCHWGGDDSAFGTVKAFLILADGTDPADVKARVKERYDRIEAETRPDGYRPVYHQAPYTMEETTTVQGSNVDPDTSGSRNRYIIYILLILIPAINLSSVNMSLLRHRSVEIGVKRAFGSTRSRIFAGLVGENLVVTLIGAVIGFAFSFVFVWLFESSLFGTTSENIPGIPRAATLLLNWRTFGVALLVCFILNLLSSAVPAMRAARQNVVSALSRQSNR